MANLAKIQTKVRRLTKAVSEAQLSTPELNEYINDFMLYEMPEQLRTFNLRKNFTFYTQPNVDTYTTDSTTELVDFKQNYLNVHQPFYLGGNEIAFTQSQTLFYGSYPQQQYLLNIGSGNGIVTNFSGTLSSFPVLRNKVLFTCVAVDNSGLRLYDDGNGNLQGDIGAASTINYLTGAYNITFNQAPLAASTVYAQIIHYQASKPDTILFFEDTFTLRPVPDGVYAVTFEVEARPTALANPLDELEIFEWWNYIAHGAALSIFEDRGDTDSMQELMPRFVELRNQIERRTIQQYSDQRTETIFSVNRYTNISPFNRR